MAAQGDAELGGAGPRKRAPGRPRGFDFQEALDACTAVFWRRGYLSASLHDLTAAAGVAKPSLYAAFGEKDALFAAALGRYFERYSLPGLAALEGQGDLRRALEAFLNVVADGQCGVAPLDGVRPTEARNRAGGQTGVRPHDPSATHARGDRTACGTDGTERTGAAAPGAWGCLLVNSGVEACALGPLGLAKLGELQARSGAALARRLRRAEGEGQLPPDADLEALALYLQAQMAGMSALARGGATRRQLDGVIRLALRALPARP